MVLRMSSKATCEKTGEYYNKMSHGAEQARWNKLSHVEVRELRKCKGLGKGMDWQVKFATRTTTVSAMIIVALFW